MAPGRRARLVWLLRETRWLGWAVHAYQQPTGVQKRGRESPDWLCGASLFVRIVCRIGWCVCVLGGLLLQALLRIKCMLICLINPRLAHPRLALPYPHLHVDQSVGPERNASSR